jgi:hypothetical protein
LDYTFTDEDGQAIDISWRGRSGDDMIIAVKRSGERVGSIVIPDRVAIDQALRSEQGNQDLEHTKRWRAVEVEALIRATLAARDRRLSVYSEESIFNSHKIVDSVFGEVLVEEWRYKPHVVVATGSMQPAERSADVKRIVDRLAEGVIERAKSRGRIQTTMPLIEAHIFVATPPGFDDAATARLQKFYADHIKAIQLTMTEGREAERIEASHATSVGIARSTGKYYLTPPSDARETEHFTSILDAEELDVEVELDEDDYELESDWGESSLDHEYGGVAAAEPEGEKEVGEIGETIEFIAAVPMHRLQLLIDFALAAVAQARSGPN